MTTSLEDTQQGIGRAPVARAHRSAVPWTDDEFDFSVRRRGSRTIILERAPDPAPEPEIELLTESPESPATFTPITDRIVGGLRHALHAVIRIGRDPMDAALATATEIDKAGAVVGERAREVGEKSAAVAHASADRVNHVRRAGLPPLRERHIDKPRITVPVSIRRPRRGLYERIGSHPDRVMLWAIGLGIFLIIIAATSSSHA